MVTGCGFTAGGFTAGGFTACGARDCDFGLGGGASLRPLGIPLSRGFASNSDAITGAGTDEVTGARLDGGSSPPTDTIGELIGARLP